MKKHMVKEPLQENGKSDEKYLREGKRSMKKNCAIHITQAFPFNEQPRHVGVW